MTHLGDRLVNGEPLPDIGQRYVLQSLVGEGGMGEVYLGRDVQMGRDVAVKIFKGEGLRFGREINIHSNLPHPAIVQAFDAGEKNGHRYIVMEYVDGKTLESVLAEQAHSNYPFPIHRACDIVCEVLSALSYTHEKGIIHRDIKPGNILVNHDIEKKKGFVKITDFGIAKRVQKQIGDQTLTFVNTSIGTAGYMAPEQIRGGAVDGRADVFGAAVVLYQLIEGRLPFDNTSSTDRDRRNENVLKNEVTHVERVDAKLESIILKNLQKNPEDRQSSQEMYESMQVYLRGGRVTLRGKNPRKERVMKRNLKIVASTAITLSLLGGMSTISKYVDEASSEDSVVSEFDFPGHPKYPDDLLLKIQSENNKEIKVKLLKELEDYVAERMNWIYDIELKDIIDRNRSNIVEAREIFPFGTSNAIGGRNLKPLTGETTAPQIIPLFYTLFKHYKDPLFLDKEKAQKFLDEFFFFSESLFFAENDSINLALDRFSYPYVLSELDLSVTDPAFYSNNKGKIDIFKDNFAHSISRIIETRYNPNIKSIQRRGGNDASIARIDAGRDHRVIFALCNAFRLLNLRKDVFNITKYGSRTRNVEDYLNIIMNDADTKLRELVDVKTGFPKVKLYQEHTALMLGMAYRINFLQELEDFNSHNSNPIVNRYARTFSSNSSQISGEFRKFLSEKKKFYENIERNMIDTLVKNRSSLILPHKVGRETSSDPIDNVATLRLLETTSQLGWPEYENLKFRILSELASKKFIAGSDNGTVSVQNPNGLIKNAWFENNPEMRGMTYVGTDYFFIKNLRALKP